MSDDYRAIIRALRTSATPEQAAQIQHLEDAFNKKVIGIADRAQVLEWGRDERVDHAFEQIDNTNVAVNTLIDAWKELRDGIQESFTAQSQANARIESSLGQVATRLGKLENDLQELNTRHGGQIEVIGTELHHFGERMDASEADRAGLHEIIERLIVAVDALHGYLEPGMTPEKAKAQQQHYIELIERHEVLLNALAQRRSDG